MKMTNSARAETNPTVGKERAWWPPFPTYHSWLTLRKSGPEFITVHFPSNEMGCTGNGSISYPAHEMLTLVATDYDERGQNSNHIRAFRDAYYPSGYVELFGDDDDDDDSFDDQEWDDLEAAIEELERHPELAPWHQDSNDGEVLYSEFSLKDPPLMMDARPPRMTTFPVPSGAPVSALQLDTRYLLSLLNRAERLDLDWEVIEVYYPEVEPADFKTLPTLEEWRKVDFVRWLVNLEDECTRPDPVYPTDPLGSLKMDLEKTYDFLRSSGLGVGLGEYNSQTDDAFVHCDIICNFLNSLPPGAIEAVA